MAVPLRTAYHSVARSSISSLSSAYTEGSESPRSTAPTTPLFRFKEGDGLSRRYWQHLPDQVSPCHSVSVDSDDLDGDDEDSEDGASVASVATYASTTPSQAQERDEDLEEYSSVPLGQVYDASASGRTRSQRAMASSPSDFAYYFPSTRLLRILHPDDTCDGNMNLTVQTDGWAATSEGTQGTDSPIPVPLTLYHLRMRNLKNRDFSLRRYCRESGREVCHSTRKYTRPAMVKDSSSGLQQRISNALAKLRPSILSRSRRGTASSLASLKKIDSGYVSMASPTTEGPRSETSPRDTEAGSRLWSTTEAIFEATEDEQSSQEAVVPKATDLPLPTNTTKLEFTNYMHLDLRRRGGRGRGNKRYEFEHWGTRYSWQRRVVRRTDERRFPNAVSESVEFHLHKHKDNAKESIEVAHIVPALLSSEEQAAEIKAGGWVPRCNMWISGSEAIGASNGAEIADVILATGLLALVDDAIKRRWDRRTRLMDRMANSLPSRKRHEHVG